MWLRKAIHEAAWRDEDPADLDIITYEGNDLAFNMSAAAKLGVEIPDDMLAQAVHVAE